jgi:hypothetical protein
VTLLRYVDDGRVYTWGCARHGRLGTDDPWDDLLVDPKDPLGRQGHEMVLYPKEAHLCVCTFLVTCLSV